MKYLAGILLLILPISCSENPAGPIYNSEFFPLEIGNRWEYTGGVEMTIEVKEFSLVDNKGYYILVRSFPMASDTLLLRYERDDRLMIYFEGDEYLYLDFSLPAGSRWNSYYHFFAEIRAVGLTDTVPAGTFNNITEVLFENTLISDVYEFNRYAPGVGMVFSGGFRRFFELKSALVNGIEYPKK
jgi:hypothetical protein